MVYSSNARMKPSEIRFIQDSISGYFQDGGHVNDAVQQIGLGELSAENFPPIQVVYKDYKHYSFDNRRLYVFRACEYLGYIIDIPVKTVSLSRLREDFFTTDNDGITIRVRQGRTMEHCKPHWFRRLDDRGNRNLPSIENYSSENMQAPSSYAYSHVAKENNQHGITNLQFSDDTVDSPDFTTENQTPPVSERSFTNGIHNGIEPFVITSSSSVRGYMDESVRNESNASSHRPSSVHQIESNVVVQADAKKKKKSFCRRLMECFCCCCNFD